jgi:hypothetical protein
MCLSISVKLMIVWRSACYCCDGSQVGDTSSGICFIPSTTTFQAPRACFNVGEANCLICGASIEVFVLPSRWSFCKMLGLITLLLMLHCFDYDCHEHDSQFNPLLCPAWRPVKLGSVICYWYQPTLTKQSIVSQKTHMMFMGWSLVDCCWCITCNE